ncbi:hypothetical protein CVT25_002653 [Psilocybe cyanescens]|uniref:Uncharacterized protein n=1 Tax=Psilocybe cyanescens TaxID=93625 RepID=A0A409WLE8_PSICY|nr:hypothetical protein CVT25_002653 [Psilocybe cyanescens]
MSPARSRSASNTAFVGSKAKGNADSKAKSKSKSKAARSTKNSREGVLEKEKSNACAPFRHANEALREGRDEAPAPRQQEVPTTTAVQPQPQAEKTKAHAHAQVIRNKESKENVVEDIGGVTSEKEAYALDLGLLGARDVRAYEHERQRVKRAEERAARRARKEREGGIPAGAAGRGTKSWAAAERVEVDGEYVVGGGKKTQIVVRRAEEDGGVGAGDKLGGARIELGTEEILLSDLVVYSSSAVQKGRGRAGRGGEEEFEMVPAVRAVIVLDDVEFGCGKRDMDVDDTWECVDGEVKEDGLSYAQVVLGLHIDG